MQYRILRALQLLPSARTKASVRFSTEHKTNGLFAALHFPRLQDQYCNVAKTEGSLWHTEGLHFDNL